MADWSNDNFWEDDADPSADYADPSADYADPSADYAEGTSDHAPEEEVVGAVGDGRNSGGGGATSASKPPSVRCPNCGSTAIESLGPQGSSVCTDCGIIVEENAIVSSVEFVEGASGASSMVGTFVGQNASSGIRAGGGRGGGGGGQYGFSRQSRENTLASGRRSIQEVAAFMRLGPHFVDSAHRLFTVAVEKNFTQGRKRPNVVAACLYIACRQEKSMHMLIDFSDALQINVYNLGTTFLKFRRLLGIKLEIIDPALFIYRFAAHLNLDEKANQVALTALRLVSRMKRDWIVAGRRPAGICAAALLIASRAHGFDKQHQDVTNVLKVCGITVMTRVREFEATSSANLTLEEFHTQDQDIEAEADPPRFTSNRLCEARAKAVAERDTDLIASGALDNPFLQENNSKKWRKPKRMTEKAKEYSEMYAELENELTEHNAEAEAAEAAERGEDIEGLGTGDGKKKEPAVSFLRAEQILEHTRPTGVSNLHVEARYPQNKKNRPIVLPNQATAEEMAPSTQKAEEILDFARWKEGVPEEAAAEVDFLFRSDDEVRQREAVFTSQNKDYIETQKEKERERVLAEAAIRAKEEDETAQEAGRRRYLRTSRSRKRDPSELTTEEALMEVVKTRKISRKINYDAMSALFDDSGNFSTDLLDDRGRKKEEGETDDL